MSIPILAFAQLTIQGKVTDDRGEALPGANVVVVGTSYGTATDNEGNFALVVPQPSDQTVIEARFIGYKSIRQSTEKKTGIVDLDFQLSVDALQFDEVVVTGVSAAISKKQLGNAISTINVRELESSGATAIDQALSGKFAGVLVQQNSGNPAGGVTIRLRGTGTVLGTADPLYIIDGVIVNNESPILIDLGGGAQNRLVDINPNDIERIEVVKGAAAAAIYGSRANNGVVQIFTKRGTQGAPRVSYTSRIMTYDVRKTLDVNMAAIDGDGNPVERFDWQDLIFRRATGTEQYLSVAGGSGDTRYFASGSYLGNQGVVEETFFQRINGRARVDQVLSDWASVTAGMSYAYNKSNEVPQGGLTSNWGSLTGFIFGPNDFDPRPDPASGVYPNEGILANPIEVIDRYDFKQRVNRFIGDTRLNLTPLPGLSADYTIGVDFYNQTATAFIPIGTSAPGLAQGFSRRAEREFLQVNNDFNLRYQKDLAQNLRSTTLVGGTLQYELAEEFRAEARELSPVSEIVPGGANQEIGEERNETTIYGIFVQETLGIADRVFITGTARYDASSRFGEDERWQFYPKGSLSYVVSEEGFWQNSALGNVFPSFKFRAAVGLSGGLTAIGPFDRFTNYVPVSYDDKAGLRPETELGGADIKPERQREIEVGADFSFLSDRLGFEFTYYDQHTTDLLLERELAPSTGFLNKLQNVGTLDNKGVELLIRGVPFDKPNFRWTSSLTFAANSNEVDGVEGDLLIISSSFGLVAAINKEPLGVFYGTAFARNEDGSLLLTPDGLPQREREGRDENGQPEGALVRKIIGDPNPDFTLSFINEFDIGRQWSVRAQFDAVSGNDVFNFTRRLAALPVFGTLEDYERELNGDLPAGFNSSVFNIFENWIEDGSFIKLRELSIAYTLYPKQFGLRSLRLSLIGRNLFSIDDYSGYDPEINVAGQRTAVRGFDFVEVPIPRSFSFGVTLDF